MAWAYGELEEFVSWSRAVAGDGDSSHGRQVEVGEAAGEEIQVGFGGVVEVIDQVQDRVGLAVVGEAEREVKTCLRRESSGDGGGVGVGGEGELEEGGGASRGAGVFDGGSDEVEDADEDDDDQRAGEDEGFVELSAGASGALAEDDADEDGGLGDHHGLGGHGGEEVGEFFQMDAGEEEDGEGVPGEREESPEC